MTHMSSAMSDAYPMFHLDCGGKVLRDAALSLRIENKAVSRSTLPPQSKQ